MEGLSKITAAPKEVMIGANKELLYPLRFLEWGQLEQWMRSEIVNAAAKTILKVESKEAIIVMRSAHLVAAQVSILQCLRGSTGDVEETMAFLRSFEGMLRVLQLSLRDSGAKEAGSKYTLSQLDDLMKGDVTALHVLFLDILDISFPSLREPEKN